MKTGAARARSLCKIVPKSDGDLLRDKLLEAPFLDNFRVVGRPCQQLRSAVRGEMYRPVKKPVTMRLDADVIHWLKSQGPGYQTKANRLLRAEMLRSLVRSGKHRQSFAARIAPKNAERGAVRRRRG